jgi:hypothetical protein
MTRAAAALCAVSLLLALNATPAAAGADPTAKCAAAKLKAAGKKYAAKTKCEAAAIVKGEPVSAECLQRAEQKFVAAFAKADSNGDCLGDPGAIDTEIDACLASLVDGITTPASTTTTTTMTTSTTATTPTDMDPPAVVSAADVSTNSVTVVFDESLDAASVQPSDFALDNGASVLAATPVSHGIVVLSTTALTPSVTYTVTVTGVTDTAGNVIAAPDNQAQFTAG